MSADTRVDEVVRRWRELLQQGQYVPAEELCAECPELIEAVVRTSEVLAIAKGLTVREGHRDYALQSCLADEAPVKGWNSRNLGLAIGNLEGRSIEDKTVHKDRRHGTNFWSLRKFGETSA